MHRTVLAAALLLAACGVDPDDPNADDRPRTLHYVTVAILKPSCGVAQCHSSFRQAANRAYDTVQRACESMVEQGDVIVGDPDTSFIDQVLVRTIDRMPYDQPMPKADRALLRDWIMIGAPGLPTDAADCP